MATAATGPGDFTLNREYRSIWQLTGNHSGLRVGLFLGLIASFALTAAPLLAEDWPSKVDGSVLVETAAGQETEVLVFLESQADLSGTPRSFSKEDRGLHVFEQLRSVARQSQKPLIQLLDQAGISYRTFWIANMIWVDADQDMVQTLARRPEVRHIYANRKFAVSLPEVAEPPLATPLGIESNLFQIGAVDFWDAGYKGQGAVVGGQDTGYDWDHPALQNHYRGWNGVTAQHDYNWHDSIHTTGSSCGANSPEPCDDGNHGTHTMGTMVGDDGGSNRIGVAPDAKWIGCRNMDEGYGTAASYSECFEFFVAPTKVDGSDPDPSKAPHVINNSWTCPPPPSEDCADPQILKTVVENTRAAGIVVVASAGNNGSSGCGSIEFPPAIYEASLTVGATNDNDVIANFSSRGGVTVDGSNRLKPNVSAPGVGIRSSTNNGNYGNMSGTSMAGPHVAGQVALLISAVPAIAGNVEALEACIEATATPLNATQDCSGIPGDQVPNNVYGRGRIQLSLPLPSECSADFLFADDLETGAPTGWQ